jgi:hypothetical protein
MGRIIEEQHLAILLRKDSKKAQSENTRVSSRNAEEFAQDFLPSLLSVSVRSLIYIVVPPSSIVVAIPQFYCSQF